MINIDKDRFKSLNLSLLLMEYFLILSSSTADSDDFLFLWTPEQKESMEVSQEVFVSSVEWLFSKAETMKSPWAVQITFN